MRFLGHAALGLVLVCCHSEPVGDPNLDSGTDATVDSGDSTTRDSSLDTDSGVVAPDTTVDAGDSPTADTADVADVLVDVSKDVGTFDCGTYKGTRMVRVETPTGPYCIDATEVLSKDYNAFILERYTMKSPPLQCESVTPTDYGLVTPAAVGEVPRNAVSWCQAYAYCQWAGKRLCGAIGGGPISYSGLLDETHNEWYHACSGGAPATHTYQYGNTYDRARCNTDELSDGGPDPDGGPTAPAAYPDCHGTSAPFDQIFDLSGNLFEWVDTCDPSPDDAGFLYCAYRGGGVRPGGGPPLDPEINDRCVSDNRDPRTFNNDWLGIRCCKTP